MHGVGAGHTRESAGGHLRRGEEEAAGVREHLRGVPQRAGVPGQGVGAAQLLPCLPQAVPGEVVGP